MQLNDRILQIARADEGTWEWAGADNNPVVVAYYAEAGHPEIKDDSVPWCAAFVGAVLAKAGVQGTGSLLARSYEKWGEKVSPADIQPGDVIVFRAAIPPGRVTSGSWRVSLATGCAFWAATRATRSM